MLRHTLTFALFITGVYVCAAELNDPANVEQATLSSESSSEASGDASGSFFTPKTEDDLLQMATINDPDLQDVPSEQSESAH